MDLNDIEDILRLIDECNMNVASDNDGERRIQLLTDTLCRIRAIALSNIPAEWRRVNYAPNYDKSVEHHPCLT